MAATGSTTRKSEALTSQQRAALRFVRGRVGAYQNNSCHWRKLVGNTCIRSSKSAERTRSVPYAQWVLKRWKDQAKRDHDRARHWMVKQARTHLAHINQLKFELGKPQAARSLAEAENVEDLFNHVRSIDTDLSKQWAHSPLLAAFTCIHHYEGAWDANTGNGYYGGLQMDWAFQKLYGPEFMQRWGTADNWPAWAQILVSVRAYRSGRGFYPWPNTARACGLI